MHPRHRSIYSQLYVNSSLPESPIAGPSLEDSDHSPDPYLYPTTYQPKRHKISRHLNLKITVTNLLSQLKEWLVELCLTEHCVREVS
jgi:hypothetical protein